MTCELPSDRPESATHLSAPRAYNKFLARLSGLADAVLPRTCGLCGLAFAGAGICPPCTRNLPGLDRARCPVCAGPVQPDLAPNQACRDCPLNEQPIGTSCRITTLALADYAMPLDRMLLAAKRGNRPHLARAVAASMARSLAGRQPAPAWPDLIIPVPLSDRRLRQRGFNQSALMAAVIARTWGLPWHRNALARVRDTPSQQGLNRPARLSNLVGAFRCATDLTGRRVALVDDVMTSGATARAGANALLQAGASSVLVLVAARTP